MAERVLGHPAFLGALGPETRSRFSVEDKRRELTAQIAEQVMRQKPATSGQVKAMALMTAGRMAVEALQEARPTLDGTRHLPPAVVMTWTLNPGSVPERIREASEKHLQECAGCREDLRTMDRIIRTLDAVDHETSREQLAEEAAHVQTALDQTVDLQEAMRAAMQEAKEERRGRSENTGRTARPSTGESKKPARMLPGTSEAPRTSAWRIWLPLVVVIVLAVVVVRSQTEDSSGASSARDPRLRELADRSPPEVMRIEEMPAGVQLVVGDFGTGDCRTAAGRIRGLIRENPDDDRLKALEVGAWVCAGDGRKALSSLDDLGIDDPTKRPPRQVWWFKAQAHLLEGDGDLALTALSKAELEDPRHRGRAGAQADQIRALRASP